MDILECIKTSTLYRELENINSVPIKYKLETLEIKNKKHLFEILDVLRYWMIDNIPYEIYDYFLKHKFQFTKSDFDNFKDFYHNDFMILFDTYPSNGQYTASIETGQIVKAIKKNCLNLMMYLIKRYNKDINTLLDAQPEYRSLIEIAIKHNSIEIVKYLYENDYYDVTYRDMFGSIGWNGSVELFKYLWDKGYRLINNWSLTAASINGNITLLKYLFESGIFCPENNKCNYRCCDHVPYCKEGIGIWGCHQKGNVECFRYVIESGCYCPESCSQRPCPHHPNRIDECYQIAKDYDQLDICDYIANRQSQN
jgi:hypothetical protein